MFLNLFVSFEDLRFGAFLDYNVLQTGEQKETCGRRTSHRADPKGF